MYARWFLTGKKLYLTTSRRKSLPFTSGTIVFNPRNFVSLVEFVTGATSKNGSTKFLNNVSTRPDDCLRGAWSDIAHSLRIQPPVKPARHRITGVAKNLRPSALCPLRCIGSFTWTHKVHQAQLDALRLYRQTKGSWCDLALSERCNKRSQREPFPWWLYIVRVIN